jgi:outer membrane protein assembly factor BamB
MQKVHNGIFKKIQFVYIAFSLIILGCNPEVDIPDDPDNDCCEEDSTNKETIPFLKYQWKHYVLDRVEGDLQWFLNYGVISTPHGVAVNYDGETKDGVVMFDKDNGSLLWRWNSDTYMASFNYYEVTNRLICHDWRDIFALNTEGGQLITEYSQDKNEIGDPHGELVGDYFYYSRHNQKETKAWIVRSHVNDLQNWENVYTYFNTDTNRSKKIGIESFNHWKDPISGDEILVFQRRKALPNRVDLVAYDLTNDSILWEYDNLCPNGKSNNNQIQIFNDKAYFLGVNTIYCVDIKTGEILWIDRHLDPLRGYISGDVVYAEQEDLIIVKDDETRLTAYDPNSGNVAWEISEIPHNGVNITYFDGYVYIAHKYLFAVDAQTGEIFKDTKRGNVFQGMIGIDEENRMLYAATYSSLYAFEIE